MGPEGKIEQRLVRMVSKNGGWAIKMSPVGLRGMPDRIVLARPARVAFVELKAPGQRPRPLQIRVIKRLQELGFDCWVVDSDARTDEFIACFFGR